jgi:hypothetical protein
MSRQETNPQTDRGVTNKRSGQNLRRRCRCDRIVAGNAAWWSHLDAAERRGESESHGYAGRAR